MFMKNGSIHTARNSFSKNHIQFQHIHTSEFGPRFDYRQYVESKEKRGHSPTTFYGPRGHLNAGFMECLK